MKKKEKVGIRCKLTILFFVKNVKKQISLQRVLFIFGGFLRFLTKNEESWVSPIFSKD